MRIFFRFFIFLFAITFVLLPVRHAAAQNLPNTTRLLRFPTTNGGQIVFCYAGELYTVGKEAELPQQLPLPRGGFVSFSPDDSKMAFNRVFREFRTWKHYRGGMADNVWIYDFKTGTTENLTNSSAQNICPMWGPDNHIYFTSDRDGRMNLFSIDLTNKETKQLTTFKDFD